MGFQQQLKSSKIAPANVSFSPDNSMRRNAALNMGLIEESGVFIDPTIFEEEEESETTAATSRPLNPKLPSTQSSHQYERMMMFV